MTSVERLEPAEMGPARSPARERRRHKARLAIARAAMRLFHERGYDATTVQDIAEAADISYRTFFRYFATKEEVVFPNVDLDLTEFEAAIGAIPADEHPWPGVRSALVDVIARFAESSSGFSADVLRVWIEDPGMAGPYARFNRRWIEAVTRAWEPHCRPPGPDAALDAEVAAQTIIGAALAAFRVYLVYDQDLRELVETALDRIEPAVGPATGPGRG